MADPGYRLTAILYRCENRWLRRERLGCHWVLQRHDAVRMHCGTELGFLSFAIASEARAASQSHGTGGSSAATNH
ncbi:MAG: hypothetical protein ACP5H2_10320 [Solirubrobacteraceae bacterium]